MTRPSRFGPTEPPTNLFAVTRNILRKLEQDEGMNDLVNQALLSLLTLVEHEHDRRKQRERASK